MKRLFNLEVMEGNRGKDWYRNRKRISRYTAI